MSQTALFSDAEPEPVRPPAPDLGPPPPPRLRRPNRQQMVMRPACLEELVPDDHDVRTVWAVVQSWDLSRFLDGLLTQMLTVLIRGGAVSVHRIAQDGTRVRVGAGAHSFQKRETLERAAPQARDHLPIIQRQAERLGEATARERAARQRAARE